MSLLPDQLREIRESVGSKCERCGTPEFIHEDGRTSLHVHHIIERGKPGGTDDRANLEVLCPKCHRKEHVSRQPPRPPTDPLKLRQFNATLPMNVEEAILFHQVRMSRDEWNNSDLLRVLVKEEAARLKRSGKLIDERDADLEKHLKERCGIIWTDDPAPQEETPDA